MMHIESPEPPADWETTLKQYGYAPGNYMSHCRVCDNVVVGLDKRAICCLPCAQSKHARAKDTPTR